MPSLLPPLQGGVIVSGEKAMEEGHYFKDGQGRHVIMRGKMKGRFGHCGNQMCCDGPLGKVDPRPRKKSGPNSRGGRGK